MIAQTMVPKMDSRTAAHKAAHWAHRITSMDQKEALALAHVSAETRAPQNHALPGALLPRAQAAHTMRYY